MIPFRRRTPALRASAALLATVLTQAGVSRLLLPPPSCETPTASGLPLTLTLTAPLPGALATAYEPCPPVAATGRAVVGSPLFDFYVVLDASGSTGNCSNADIDGDGIVGVDLLVFPFTCSDPDDTVLAAEVEAVRDFVAVLDAASTRVAVIEFSWPDAGGITGPRQRIVQPLTADFGLVGAALDDVVALGSEGATDYGGAMELVLQELAANGDPGARQQRCFFLSDGVPTYPVFPFNVEDAGDALAAVDGADAAAAVPLVVDTFGVGFVPGVSPDPVLPRRCEEALPGGGVRYVSTLECMALRTGGSFFASPDPADILEVLRRALPPGILSVVVFNDTTGGASPATLTADGAWTAEVPLAPGLNELRAVATATDGTSCEVATSLRSLCFAAGCAPLTQGYWHRQCMGLGLIPDLSAPPHPDWDPAVLLQLMVEQVDPLVASLGSPVDPTTCAGLDAQPEDDPCQRAIKQYAALLMNVHGGRLGPGCELDFSSIAPDLPTDPAGAVALVDELIRLGLAGDEDACKLANDIADLVNTGAALR